GETPGRRPRPGPGHRPARAVGPSARGCAGRCRLGSGHGAGVGTRASPPLRDAGGRAGSSRSRRSCERLLRPRQLAKPAERGLQARLCGVDRNLEHARSLLDTQVLVIAQRDRGALVCSQLAERMCQVNPCLARRLMPTAAEAAEALSERLEAVAPAISRDAFIHGDSCEPRSRVFVVQTADPLPGFEKRLLDGVFGQCFIAQDQTSRPEQLEAVAVYDLLEGVTVAFSPAGDDAPERGIHEHANRRTLRVLWTGEMWELAVP